MGHGARDGLQIWENDGKGSFAERRVEPGKERHLGACVADLDGDGDLDIVSVAWRNFRYLHNWRNDAIQVGRAEVGFTRKGPRYER